VGYLGDEAIGGEAVQASAGLAVFAAVRAGSASWSSLLVSGKRGT